MADTMDEALIDRLGDELYDALRARRTLAPLTERHPAIAVDDAYRISLRFLARREADGERVTGKKIGVTSKAVQDMLGVFQPDFGFLTDRMQVHKLQRDEMIDCSFGAYRMGPRILHDHHSYGALSEDVLVKSSNIGMARIAERIGLEALYEATCSFGFGRRTGIELPGELPGIVQPLKRWNIYSLGSVPMGQELAVTPLQLITAHVAIANGGKLIRPRLVRTMNASSENLVAPTVDVETPFAKPRAL